ncbi:alpha/beta hydrolase family protein [Salicibibacter kimchii]|uniref:S9 family peptidase n=1 Tax=Salicibibacter kimchii TaxID=2099786 RepID=A0A345C0F9_9BACI|nr:S9 family peptidase [Salicibibacter kimchii]AXF56690.1 S9 family peptidase [Salicibibacter kimchii]
MYNKKKQLSVVPPMLDKENVSDFLQIAKVFSPAFASDSNTLSFITDAETGLPQLWAYDFNTGQKTQVLHTDDRVMFVKHLPDSATRIIGMDAKGNERKQLYMVDADHTLHRLTPDDKAIYQYGGVSADGRWIAWASNEREPAYYDLYIANLEDGRIHKIYEANHATYNIMGWHPDGTHLLVQEKFTNLYNCLGLLNIANGNVEWITLRTTYASYSNPSFSKDGKQLYILSNQDREFTSLAKVNLETHALTWLSEHNWDAGNLTIDQKGAQLAYTTNEAGVYRGWLYDLENNRLVDWEVGMGTIEGLAFNTDGSTLAFIFNGPTKTPDMWTLDTRCLRKINRLHCTSTTADFEAKLQTPTIYTIESFDGLDVPSFLYKPKNLKTPAPLAFWVHGGPESQTKAEYQPVIQCLVNLGYIVCAPNVRGSRGYGRTYIHLDDVRKRMDSVHDLVEIADTLKKEPEVDEHRMAVIGRSYGGFMVLAAVSHYPNVFDAGISLVGISSFRTFLENTGPWRRKLREIEYGTIEADGAFFDQIDPIHHTDRITAPLLVSHGANDPRVPIVETEQMIDGLRKRDHPIDYIRFEDEGHGIVKMKNQITAYTGMVEFLEKHFAENS